VTYTSDTHDEGPTADVDRKNKKVVVDGSLPPVSSQKWVAFCTDDDYHLDRISVLSTDGEPVIEPAVGDSPWECWPAVTLRSGRRRRRGRWVATVAREQGGGDSV
jgi:hypothetical protein